MLDIQNSRDALLKLDDDEKADVGLTDTSSNSVTQSRTYSIISESGLYTLILRCRDATTPGTVSHRFRKWVTAEVLPSIRKTGRYEAEEVLSSSRRSRFSRASRLSLLLEDLPDDVRWLSARLKRDALNFALQAARLEGGTPEVAHDLFIDYCRVLSGGDVVRPAFSGISPEEAQACLAHLLALSVGQETLKDILHAHDTQTRRALRRCGVVVEVQGKPGFMIVANCSRDLEQHFAKTRWSGGGWVRALRALPGSLPAPATAFGAQTSRGTYVRSDGL